MEGNKIMQVDEMSGIPRAVILQGQTAVKLQNEMSEGMRIDPEKVDDPEKTAKTTPESDDKDNLTAESEEDEDLKELVGDDDTDPDKTVKKDDDLAKKDEQEEKRYKALQGMFDRYKLDTQAIIDNLKNEIQSLKAEKLTLNSVVNKLAAGEKLEKTDFPSSDDDSDDSTAADDVKVKRYDPDKFKDFGPEIVDMAKTINTLLDQNEKLLANQEVIQQTADTIQEDSATKALNSFKADMAKRVHPNWEDINHDPLFFDWLQENPEYNTEVNTAGQELNALRASNVFNLFIRETGYTVDDKAGDDTTDTDDNELEAGDDEFNLDDEVIPEVNSSDQTIDTNQGKIPLVTRRQYQLACNKFALGKMPAKDFELLKKRFNYAVKKGLA